MHGVRSDGCQRPRRPSPPPVRTRRAPARATGRLLPPRTDALERFKFPASAHDQAHATTAHRLTTPVHAPAQPDRTGDPLGLANGKRPCGAPLANPRSAAGAEQARTLTGDEPDRWGRPIEHTPRQRGEDWRAGKLTEDEILARLFRLNQVRAAKEAI